jgi:hypothetical protein
VIRVSLGIEHAWTMLILLLLSLWWTISRSTWTYM